MALIGHTMNHDPENSILSKVTAEFLSKAQEEAFLRYNWSENKGIARNTLLVLGFLSVAFFVRDILEMRNRDMVYALFGLRVGVASVLLGSVFYIHRSREYFENYPKLIFLLEIFVSMGVFILAIKRDMFFAYLGVNTILFTLIFYQFLNIRFYYTVGACAFLAVGSLVTSIFYLDMDFSGFIGSILFLVPINFLGIIILRSINRAKRSEYVSFMELKKSNEENERLIKELKSTLDEVRVLRGFIPICAHCKKIRNDEGYWQQIEWYLEEHSQLEFSHGICPECAEKTYGKEGWYQKMKKEME